mgnify:CR=1 FL=1
MSEVVNIPQLRFPEFNGEWEEKALGVVATITTGSTPSTSNNEYYDGDVAFVSPADIQGNRIVRSTKTTITELGLSVVREIKKRSTLFVCIGSTIGKVSQAGVNCATNQQINALTAKNSFDNDFIYSLLEFKAPRIKLLAGVQAVPQINKSEFSRFKFTFPLLPEQQKIAAFLTAVDNKIEQLSKKQELLGEYKKGLMQKIFSQAIRFKADDGSEFPDWEEKKLGDLIAEISDGGTPPTSNKGNFGGGINWVVIDDIRDEIRITKETLTETGLSNSSSKLWKPETIILSTGATIGRVGIAKIYTTTKQGVCGIVVNQFTSNLFLKYWFIFNINLLKRFSQGSSIKEVRPPTLIKFDISTPSLPEQTKIANFLSSIDSKIEQVGKQLDESKQFKKALLQQMFV